MFKTLINREENAAAGWQKIPWGDPDFSRRMLAEHLDQSHDLASRRATTIDQHVAWIHRKILGGRPAKVLDMGCGPGFYTARLAALGHTCTGVDVSPTSIAYAREHHPGGEYVLGDICEVDVGGSYDFAAMIYGELNAFASEDAARIVEKARAALKPGGKLLLEVHRHAFIHRIGQEPPSWHTAKKGLFADEPYLCLVESSMEGDDAITRHYVITENGDDVQRYTAMHHAYTDDEYRRLLDGFERVMFYPSLTGDAEEGGLFVVIAEA